MYLRNLFLSVPWTCLFLCLISASQKMSFLEKSVFQRHKDIYYIPSLFYTNAIASLLRKPALSKMQFKNLCLKGRKED